VFFIRYKLRQKKLLCIKHATMQRYRISTFVICYTIAAPNLTADDILLIIGFESVSYEERRQRFDAQCPEQWPRFG